MLHVMLFACGDARREDAWIQSEEKKVHGYISCLRSKTVTEGDVHFSDARVEIDALALEGTKDMKVMNGVFATFATHSMTSGKRSLFVIRHADALTMQAQASLRRCMETRAKSYRFVLCVEDGSTILDPVRSRCTPVRLAAEQPLLPSTDPFWERVLHDTIQRYVTKRSSRVSANNRGPVKALHRAAELLMFVHHIMRCPQLSMATFVEKLVMSICRCVDPRALPFIQPAIEDLCIRARGGFSNTPENMMHVEAMLTTVLERQRLAHNTLI